MILDPNETLHSAVSKPLEQPIDFMRVHKAVSSLPPSTSDMEIVKTALLTVLGAIFSGLFGETIADAIRVVEDKLLGEKLGSQREEIRAMVAESPALSQNLPKLPPFTQSELQTEKDLIEFERLRAKLGK